MSGADAPATLPPMIVITVAPVMMIVSPAAASGVRLVRIRRRPGRISPMAPRTSATPMKRMNSPGRGTGPASASTGTTSFTPPASRNIAASSP